MTTDSQPLHPLTAALIDLEKHISSQGWDQAPGLYALVAAHDLAEREPQLAAALGLPDTVDHALLVPIEQEWAPDADGIDASLAQIAWPDSIIGAAIVIERFLLPSSAEQDVLAETDDEAIARAAAEHPEREEVRLVAGVTRDGRQMCVLRLRSRDSDQEVLSGADLLPGLTTALRTTFE